MEKCLAVVVLMSPQSVRSPYRHLAKPVLLFLVQSTSFPLHSALFVY